MSNKSFDKLNDLDRRLRRCFGLEMWSNGETLCTIRLFGGFEIFNTRPYHNYETWANGYEITTGERYGNISVSSEDLDDAITLLEKAIQKIEKPTNHHPQ